MHDTDKEQLKRAVLLQRLQQRNGERRTQTVATKIPRADRSQPLPLSWAQQRLWFLDQFDHAAGVAYHMPAALRLRGKLDRGALRATLNRIVARHENLRTRFVCNDGIPTQVIAPADAQFQLVERDLCDENRTREERDELAFKLIEADATAAFDLDTGPLIRGLLLRLAEDEHILLINKHHIVSDGWSIGVLIREVRVLYDAFHRGLADPLPALDIQYADFAVWQRRVLQGETLQRQVDFWARHLKDAPALLELPTDHPRPTLQSHAGGFVEFSLTQELTAQLRAFSQRHGATLFMTLLTGWSILLSRLSGQRDVVVGTPFANRQCKELEPLTGLFVNSLAIRSHLEDDSSVAQLLAQIKATTLDAYAHQDMPFEHVFEVLQPVRSMSHSPIFQVMLALDNTPTDALSVPGLTLEAVRLPRTTAYFDLSLFLQDADGVLSGNFEYASSLFEQSTVVRFAGHFECLLEGMVAQEHRQVSQLALIDARERARLLVDFNDTAADFPCGQLLHQLVENQASAQPDAIAVVFDGETLTFDALNRRANRLAHRLIELGVQPDTRVAICLERSLDMIVGLLAILKAGGAYVPLDPAYPPDRLAFMLADSAPIGLITQAHLRGRLQAGEGLAEIVLDDPATESALEQFPEGNPDAHALGLTSLNLAYVIYTSGSTGQPKGVMLEHRNVVNLVHGHVALCELTSSDRVMQFASFSFDNSVVEVFPALSAGARIVLRPADVMVPDAAFVEFLDAQAITVTDLPTAFWHQWAQEISSKRSIPGTSLRLVLAGGEKAELRYLADWFEEPGVRHARWINTYGPTEAAVNSAVLGFDFATPLPAHEIPIGRPVANGCLYILDTHLQPLPIGVAGEIHIGGAGVARGYLNRPELTAEKFIRDPYSAAPDARMYKTGDLGRWLADGTVEYLGRNDFQVKIRGFRIELGEIEAKLCGCSGVREAVVIAREDVPGDKRLVAYVVPSDAELSVAALRSELAALLPEHMLPAAFVQLASFPLTPNGKLDRKALPAPDASAVLARAYAAPQGAIETAIAAIWQDLLGLERVGRHDHFFELGGHSLLVVGLIERLRQQGIHASVRSVFSAPTLDALAAQLAEAGQTHELFVAPPNRIRTDCTAITPELLPLVELTQGEIDSIVANVPGGAANIQDIYPLAPLQEGILFHHLLETEGDVYLLRSIMVFDNRALLDSSLAALQAVIDRHDILRSAVCWEGLGRPVQVVHRHAALAVEEFAPHVPDNVLQQLIDYTDPQHIRIDLRRAPLLTATVVHNAGTGEWLMALLQHHIVTDHVTLELLLAEARELLEGRADSLPAPVPYRNFIAQVASVPLAVHEDYFRNQLADVCEPTAPFGIFDVHANGGQVSEWRLPLEADLARRIRACARQHGVSTAVLFHVAWARVIAQCSGRDDVVFGTTLSGRLQGSAGADRVLGMFINTLPVRIALAGCSVRQSIKDCFGQLGELVGHEQASLALAQRCSGVNAASPLFTTLLNYHHTLIGEALDDPADVDAFGRDLSKAMTIWDGMRILCVEERTNYPITISVDDLGEGFSLISQCVAGIDAGRVGGYLATTLASLVDALEHTPQAPVLGLPMLPEDERAQLLGAEVAASLTEPTCIHGLFEEHAQMRPDALALTLGDASLSYAELNRRANRLAHHLIAMGVCPDARVAICIERSLDMVVGLLAILKAGGAYVPLDPAYPAERLAFMLADSAPLVLITQETLRERLQPVDGVPLIVLDEPETLSTLQQFPEHNPAVPDLAASHLAYVIYTSGSTGQPKGVMVEHGHVARLFAATQNEFFFDDTDVWTLFHSFAFDFSVWELFGALLHGGRLVIVPGACARNPEEFYALLCHERVTVLNQTPSAFRQLIGAQANSEREHALRCIVFGGEALELHTLAAWIARNDLQRTQLVNMYGITEITVHATYRALSTADIRTPSGSLIGGPLADLRLYILDAYQQPVPIGVAGEIHIGGAGVARGYLNRPELTAEKFIRDPYSAAPDARMYKTGDLGRWLADGTVEYLGRNDFQVKIRGFRIELGEIEAKLCGCSGVREAVVIAREDVAGDKRLIAYVLPSGAELSVAALRSELAALLPEHMLPAAFVQLASFPLTPNGKLDRKALPAPDASAVLARAYAAPQGAIETVIAAIWQDLLGLERIGRHDHFFELGGHSLLVVGLIERLRQQGIHASVRSVFSAPTLDALAAQLAEAGQTHELFVAPPNRIRTDCTAITPELLPLVELTQDEIDTVVANVPGGAANIQDIYPLAPLQEGILFHHLLDTEGDAYLLRSVLAFDCRRRLDVFLDALQQVIDRHDILRTAIRWQGLGQPVQVVHRQAPMPIVEQTFADDALERLLELTDPRTTRMDLTRAPLLSANVTEEAGSGEWLLALLSHHLIDDNYTMQLVLAEVQEILEGRGDTLPPSLPYRNFIAQTRAVPADQHEAYFREQLGDIDAPTVAFGVLEVQGGGAGIEEAHAALDGTLAQSIRNTARQHGVTAAVLFHAAWAQVLATCSGRDEVVFGTTLSGRLQGTAGADRVLGMFINTLPIRIGLKERNAKHLVDETYRALGGLLEHEQAPLALAQRCSGVAAPLPLFTSLLNYRHTQLFGEQPVWDGVRLLHGQERTSYPLTVSIDDRGEDFLLIAQGTSGIDPARILGYFGTALEGLVAALVEHSEQSVLLLPVLPDSERRQVLIDFNDSAVTWPSQRLLHSLVEDQASAQPAAVAVVFEQHSLSYAELNARANRLAHHLIALGVRPDARVAICIERSLDMVVGLLAILKAGGAYVPLDPAYPAERLAFMLADSAPLALITQQTLRERLQPVDGLALIVLDDPATLSTLQQGPDHNPDPLETGLKPDHLAYVIYTSGSTGQPKGVMNQHDGVVNRLLWASGEYAITTRDCVLQKTPFSFDVSVWEFFLPLIAGARLVLARPGGHQDPHYLVQTIQRAGITMLHFVPSMLHVFLDQIETMSCTSLRRVKCSGEALPHALQERFHRSLPDVQLHNLYGPTEAAIDVTSWRCNSSSHVGKVPIGKPIANTQIYILDTHAQPVPIGVAGEIHIGGAGVARGYLNRPELTAEKFIRDPYSAAPDARMYKTGDLGRWLADGTVEYLGRNDFQVKIRGFRIELGEIEAKLCGCSGVREAVVIAREDVPGDKRLVAYVLPSGAELSVAALRSELAALLPEHMLPAAFVQLASFPLTPNGKLDRKALPDADNSAASSTREFIAPRTAMEIAIAEIWARILDLDKIGVHDNFFELGGHSLKAATATFQINSKLPGNPIALADFYRRPTIKAVAAIVTGVRQKHELLQQLLQSRKTEKLTLICCPYAGAPTSVFQPLSERMAALSEHTSVYAVAIPGNELGTTETTGQGVESLAESCVATILEQVQGPIAVYGHCIGSYLALEITRRLELAGRRVEFLGVGGAFPATRFGKFLLGKDLWVSKSDAEIHAMIRSWGGSKDPLDADLMKFMIGNFRRDSLMASRYERGRGRWKITAPIHCIVGTADQLTPNYNKLYKRWNALSDAVQLHVIDGGHHYFIADQADHVARMIHEASHASAVQLA